MEEQRMTMAEAINLALDQAMARDNRVVLLGEDVGDPAGGVIGVTRGLSTKYGHDRVRDTAISESAIVGAAVGASLGGYRPVAEIMIMDFIGIAVDQIVNHAAKLRFVTGGRTPVPLTVRTMVLGGMNMGTGSTHSQSLEAWFMHIPGMKVVVPSGPADAKGLMTSAIFDDDPVLFMEPAALYGTRGPVPVEPYSIPLGQANVVRSGNDVTVVTYGLGVKDALDAAARLQEEGVSVEVIDLRSLVPLDMPTVIESVSKTRRAVVSHMATRFAGPGAEISALITEALFSRLLAPVGRVGAKFVPVASSSTLEAAAFPCAADVVEAIRRTMQSAAVGAGA